MGLGKWKLFGGYYRAYSSEAYNDTMSAVEHLASVSLLLLDRKPEEERREILAKAQSLTEKLSDTVATRLQWSLHWRCSQRFACTSD